MQILETMMTLLEHEKTQGEKIMKRKMAAIQLPGN